MLEIGLGVAFFTAIVVALSALILAARGWLVPSGNIHLTINDERMVDVPVGDKLLNALAGVGLYLPAGCGGKGTCGQCRCQVLVGGGDLLPTEAALLSHRVAQVLAGQSAPTASAPRTSRPSRQGSSHQ